MESLLFFFSTDSNLNLFCRPFCICLDYSINDNITLLRFSLGLNCSLAVSSCSWQWSNPLLISQSGLLHPPFQQLAHWWKLASVTEGGMSFLRLNETLFLHVSHNLHLSRARHWTQALRTLCPPHFWAAGKCARDCKCAADTIQLLLLYMETQMDCILVEDLVSMWLCHTSIWQTWFSFPLEWTTCDQQETREVIGYCLHLGFSIQLKVRVILVWDFQWVEYGPSRNHRQTFLKSVFNVGLQGIHIIAQQIFQHLIVILRSIHVQQTQPSIFLEILF